MLVKCGPTAAHFATGGQTWAVAHADPARLVRPEQRVEADPTAGMIRERAIDVDGLWAGFVRTAPGAISDWHHHGEYESSIYVASGQLRLESGPDGKDVITAVAGDFVHVPKGAIHREGNDAEHESHLVVVRAGHGVPTINVAGPAPSE